MDTYQLFRWWRYRHIKHKDMGSFVWGFPIAITLPLICVYLLSPAKPNILGQGGVLSAFTIALSVLPGFLIAGLATVAAISNSNVDEELPMPTPTLPVKSRGEYREVKLTARLFLLSLFSYISILSIVLLIISVIGANLFDPKAVAVYTANFGSLLLRQFIEIVLLALYAYFLSSLFISLMHGIYFLAERVHKPD